MHTQLIRQVVTRWGDVEADMILLSREGEKVVTQKVLLSFFSPQDASSTNEFIDLIGQFSVGFYSTCLPG